MARTLIVMVLLLAGFPAKADQCDRIVADLIAQTPGLQLDKRMPAEGADIVYLKHPQAVAISIFCPVPPLPSLALSADWLQDPAPPAYFQLIGKLGSVLTGVSAHAISTGAIACEKRALAAKGEEGNVEFSGIRFQCQAFEHAGGGTTLLLAPAANTIPPG
jgi:hypothetical protein